MEHRGRRRYAGAVPIQFSNPCKNFTYRCVRSAKLCGRLRSCDFCIHQSGRSDINLLLFQVAEGRLNRRNIGDRI